MGGDGIHSGGGRDTQWGDRVHSGDRVHTGEDRVNVKDIIYTYNFLRRHLLISSFF